MVVIIQVSDLPTSLQSADMIDLMVDGANARATRVAPCLAGTGEDAPTEDQLAEAKLILIGAVKRWHESGSGALQSQTAGPFGQTIDTRQRTGFNLWPSEISDLQEICRGEDFPGGAFTIDTTPSDARDGYWSAPDVWTPLEV